MTDLDAEQVSSEIETSGQLDALGEACDDIERAENMIVDAISILKIAALSISDPTRLQDAAEQIAATVKDDVVPVRIACVTAHQWAADDMGE